MGVFALVAIYCLPMQSLLRKLNMSYVAQFIGISKMFLATVIAQSFNVPAQHVLLLNNLIVELLSRFASFVQEYKFEEEPAEICVIVADDLPESYQYLHDQVEMRWLFSIITKLVIDAYQKQNKTISVQTISIMGQCVPIIRSKVDIEFEFNEKTVRIKGDPQKKTIFKVGEYERVCEWRLSSQDFKTYAKFRDFVDSFESHEFENSDDEINDQNENVFWVKKDMTDKHGTLPNALFIHISSFMLPHCPKTDVEVSYVGSYGGSNLQFAPQTHGHVYHTFTFNTHKFSIEKAGYKQKPAWKVVTSAPTSTVDAFFESINPKFQQKEREAKINLFVWKKSTVASSQSKEDEESKQVDQVQTYVWDENHFTLGKSYEKYFPTEKVEQIVIKALDDALQSEEKRKAMGVGLSQNYLLEGKPGTGKTTFAYHFARILQQRHKRCVTVVHMTAEIMKSAEMFADATSKLTLSPDAFDTVVILIDEADKLPFFKGAERKEGVDESTFLSWLDADTIAEGKSRFVFAMVNDPSVLSKFDEKMSGALFRQGRFGTRVHVGGCDRHQFDTMCRFVFAGQFDEENEIYQRILDLCEKQKDNFDALLTVKQAQDYVIKSDFCFVDFLNLVNDHFKKAI